ncbi:MAG: hypothetical protein AAGU27_01550 [Dehalobacterium sp.]
MKKGFSQSKNNIWVINLSAFPFLLILSICFIFATIMLWHNSEPTASETVIPTFPAEDDPLLYEGESANTPWSGWWWPFYEKSPPNLYNPNEAMDKYDQVSIARGKPNPQTMAWEKKNHYTDKKEEGWFGHCNGWAAAAVLEPEPKSPRNVSGVDFKINDIMGLLSEWHWWDSAVAFYGTRYDGKEDNIDDIFPHEFHYIIINYMGRKSLPIIMDISGGTEEEKDPQVWNFPAFRYKLAYRPDEKDSEKIHVHCQVWFSDFTRPDSLRLKTFVKDYYYWIKGDKGRPISGEWETAKEGGWGSHGNSKKSHPDFLWYPATAKRHPILDRTQYLEIVGQGEER